MTNQEAIFKDMVKEGMLLLLEKADEVFTEILDEQKDELMVGISKKVAAAYKATVKKTIEVNSL